jgi:hypothetical protein
MSLSTFLLRIAIRKNIIFWLKICCYSFLEQPGFEGETTGTDGSNFFSRIFYNDFPFDITL